MLTPGRTIILCALALLTIGVVMVNSAGMTVRAGTGDLFASLLTSRPVIYMALSLGALGAASMLPLGRLGSRTSPSRPSPMAPRFMLGVGTCALAGILALVYVPGLGREVNGSHRWIALPAIGLASIQVSEIAKWGLILVLAWYGAHMRDRMRAPIAGLGPALVATAIVAGMVAVEDLGTGVLIACVGAIVLIAGGARLWPFLALTPVAAAAGAALVLTSPYRLERLTTFLHPYADPQGAGYHMIQSMAAIAGGEGFGRGLGHGLQKFGYLPEDRTDFVFAVISEELGIAGAGMVIALYIALIWACVVLVARRTHVLFRLVGVGVIATIGMQAIINLFVVTGMAPTKGIALPLVSAGGTGWLLTSAALGLLVAMERSEMRMARRHEAAGDITSATPARDRAPPIVVTANRAQRAAAGAPP